MLIISVTFINLYRRSIYFLQGVDMSMMFCCMGILLFGVYKGADKVPI